MDRREALKISTYLLGFSISAGSVSALLGGCKANSNSDFKSTSLSEDELSLLAEICETILPKMDTPGAKDALCHRYIDEMLTNFMSNEEAEAYKKDLLIFDKTAKDKYSKAFIALNNDERLNILKIIADELKGKEHNILKRIREQTITGYFTSEVGAKGGLNIFSPVPGPYQGCVPYETIGKGYVLN